MLFKKACQTQDKAEMVVAVLTKSPYPSLPFDQSFVVIKDAVSSKRACLNMLQSTV